MNLDGLRALVLHRIRDTHLYLSAYALAREERNLQ
jgi:hypothetical protein